MDTAVKIQATDEAPQSAATAVKIQATDEAPQSAATAVKTQATDEAPQSAATAVDLQANDEAELASFTTLDRHDEFALLQSTLRCPTDPRWAPTVLGDFDAFLRDHASCERKAVATCMSFVMKYPARLELVDTMIKLAREELEHFHQVSRVLKARELPLGNDEKDPYINRLMGHIRTGFSEHLMDRLLMAGVVEARGCERFFLLAEALHDRELKLFYFKLSRSEARHFQHFFEMAESEFGKEATAKRLGEWLDIERDVVQGLALRPALH